MSTGSECDPTIGTCPSGNQIGCPLSIVHLSSSLGLLQASQAPGTAGGGHDWDFGSSPALFGSGSPPSDVGACNKTGLYSPLAANPRGSAPRRADAIGALSDSGGRCLAGSVWSGSAGALDAGGDPAVIGGTSYGGSVRQVHR